MILWMFLKILNRRIDIINKEMKTLNAILNESLLDADFDVGVEDVYADNIVNKIIEIASSTTIKDHDKTVKELHDLLKNTAREQRDANISVMRRLRSKDNTSIFMSEATLDVVNIFIRRFVKNPRPYLLHIQLMKQDDGSCRVYKYHWRPVNHVVAITPAMNKTLVFMEPRVWDEVVEACGKK